MTELKGKVAVITGGGAGIGRALAVQLARRGCRVAIADLHHDGLEETSELVAAEGAACSTHVVDVSDRDAMQAFATDVVRVHGAAHVIINNAGVTLIASAEEVSIADFEWVMNVDFWGVVYGTKAFLPYLRQVDEAHIVNVSSLFGLMAMPLQSAYSASKFAVRGYTESLKMELAGSPIHVSCVHPGGIKTDIARNARIAGDTLDVPKAELGAEFEKSARTSPDKAARKIIRGIEKNKRRILIGPDARIFDWVVRHFPGSYEKLLRLEKKVLQRKRVRTQSVY